jgi:protein ImuB
VQAGMKRATALALAPQLLLGQADAQRDAAALLAVAHVALAFTPEVVLAPGHTVLLQVQASLRLFGGLQALLTRLHADLATLWPPAGHAVQVAAAPTAVAAALLACRAAGGANAVDAAVDWVFGPHHQDLEALTRLLDQAPLGLLAAAREHAVALQGMGLSRLGELRQLPRAGLARRFGAALLLELDQALGLAPDPRQWLELPAAFEARLELAHRADTSAQVLAAAALLLARLVAWAQARQVRIVAFGLIMKHEVHRGADEAASVVRVEMAEPSLDAAHLQLLLRERLAAFVLPAPTLELRLVCTETRAVAAPNGELFPARQAQALGLARLLERLRARLGDAAVQSLQAVADHRPERASQTQPTQSTQAAAARKAAWSASGVSQPGAGADATSADATLLSKFGGAALPLQQPLWLLPEPQPLAQRGARPLWEGQPLRLLSGPERIETGWWDGALAARDYYIAMAPNGALLWLWRQRLAQGQADGNGSLLATWMLQGRFG